MSIEDYSQLYADAGQQYGVDPRLLMAQGQAESGGDPKVVSSSGAVGLAQLMPETAKSLGVTDPTDPKQAIPAQAKLMAENLKRYGNTETALKAYHGGTDQSQWGPKTQAYPAKVMSNMQVSDDPFADARNYKPEQAESDDPFAEARNFTPGKEIKAVENTKSENKSSTKPDQGAVENFGQGVGNFGAGIIHGALPVVTNVLHALNYIPNKLYGQQPTPFEDLSRAAQEGIVDPAYKKINADSNVAAAGDMAGQVIATAPVLGPLGEAIPIGGNLLTRTIGRGAQGALQGAGFNALTNQDVKTGAETGAALNAIVGPAVYSAGKGVIDMGKSIVQPFTNSGPESIANDIIKGFAGDNPLSVNANELVPGSQPTLAEATGNPGIAQLQDTLRDVNSQPFVEREQANAAARNNALMKAAGTEHDIEAASTARAANAKIALGDPENGVPGTLFAKAKSADSSPVVNTIDDILNGPEGQRDAVKKALSNIRSKLVIGTDNTVKPPIYDASGKVMNPSKGPQPILQSDPETLYKSVRKQINDLIDSKDLSSDAGRNASAQLISVRDKLDDSIEQSVPGFKKYLDDYSQSSKPINAMQWMQGLKLTDQNGNITLSKVQNALANIKNMKNTPGINNAKNLSDTQVSTLESIRDDLLRRQNLTIGKSYGSPSIQKANAANKLSQIMPGSQQGLFSGKMNPEFSGAAGGAALGSLVGAPTAGAVIGSQVGKAVNKAYAAKNEIIMNRLQQMLMEPNSYAPVSNGNSFAAGLLQNPLLHLGGETIGISGVNRLTSPQPVNNAH